MVEIIVWLIIIVAVFYTSLIAIGLWLSKNKSGAIAVGVIALAILIVPNAFTVLTK